MVQPGFEEERKVLVQKPVFNISNAFIFMFTHYGDHGLGDNARIPLGHHKEITETNGTDASIQDVDNGIDALGWIPRQI